MVMNNMKKEDVCECIYTGSTEPAIEAEHIFPKCIGGVGTLPVGYVADSVNSAFSKLELGFARQYPPVVINRMFSVPMGRKKHRNREKVGLMKDRDNNGEYMLGFVRNGIPMAIDQIVISMGRSDAQNHGLPVRIVVGPNEKMPKEEQISAFWEQLKHYNGSPTCIKDLNVPPKTCLLGAVDNRWILCIAKNENPEDIKPKLKEIVDQITTASADMLLSQKGPIAHEQRVEAEFSFTFNYVDIMRVYAKIAVNCLAKVKGHDFVMDSALAEIKQAILTGENIERYTTYAKGPNPIPESLRNFPDRVLLGERPHCAVFFQDSQGDLIAFIALFGTENPIAIKLGRFKERVGVDFYLCDWEHKADYTMTDFVLKVCRYDEESELDIEGTRK